jgi:hypothetical protein
MKITTNKIFFDINFYKTVYKHIGSLKQGPFLYVGLLTLIPQTTLILMVKGLSAVVDIPNVLKSPIEYLDVCIHHIVIQSLASFFQLHGPPHHLPLSCFIVGSYPNADE